MRVSVYSSLLVVLVACGDEGPAQNRDSGTALPDASPLDGGADGDLVEDGGTPRDGSSDALVDNPRASALDFALRTLVHVPESSIRVCGGLRRRSPHPRVLKG